MKKILSLFLFVTMLTGCSGLLEFYEKKNTVEIATNYYEDDQCYNYYYQSLNIKEQEMYRNIYNCIYEYSDVVTLSSNNLSTVQKISDYVLYDHPEFFYLDYFELEDTGTLGNYYPNYTYTKKEVKKINNQLISLRNDFLSTIDKNTDNYNKIKEVYKYVIEHCVYDENAKDNQHITSSLLNGSTVCSGYVKAIQYLLEPLKINSAYIIGQAFQQPDDESKFDYHAWNMIELDGDYYYLDATWGDYDSDGNVFTMYSYFMFDSTTMKQLYTPTDLYNETTNNNNTYFIHEGYYSDIYDLNTLEVMADKYRDANIEWMEFKFSESAYSLAKNKLIEQEQMFKLFDKYSKSSYSVLYIYYDDLKVLLFKKA